MTDINAACSMALILMLEWINSAGAFNHWIMTSSHPRQERDVKLVKSRFLT